MNRDKALLDLNLRLLVAQHGKERVSEALSAMSDITVDKMRDDIEAFGKSLRMRRAPRSVKNSTKNIEELIRDANPGSSEAASIIEQLARAYENKEFLPALRDVVRFLASRSALSTTLRSRAAALPTVIKVLAQCELDELRSLDRRRQTQGGDLGVITDQILGSGHATGR